MCELFCFSSRRPTRTTFSLRHFAAHGAPNTRNIDGWGVAFHDGRDVRLFKEPEPAGDSVLLGFIEHHLGDANCRTIDNCGPGNVSDTVCDAARNIPNEANVQLPAMYTDVSKPMQPSLVPLAAINPVTGAKQPWHSQISHLTVTKVVLK